VGIAPMDNPEYIVLVALDTPSRATGMYISGGVMAAPTVGAVMADILPYLGVQRNYTENDAAGQMVVLEDMSGLNREDAQKLLKSQGLTARILGNGETVTGQIPAAGQTVPGASEVLLYMGEEVPEMTVGVPDFSGMNRAQAAAAAGQLGLYVLVIGSNEISPEVVVTLQDIPAGTHVASGTTIQLQFTDTGARD